MIPLEIHTQSINMKYIKCCGLGLLLCYWNPTSVIIWLSAALFIYYICKSLIGCAFECAKVIPPCFAHCVLSFVCVSSSGWCDRGAFCLRDGVGSKHRSGQELYVALLRERTAAGHIQDHSMGVWTTVSIHTSLLIWNISQKKKVYSHKSVIALSVFCE